MDFSQYAFPFDHWSFSELLVVFTDTGLLKLTLKSDNDILADILQCKNQLVSVFWWTNYVIEKLLLMTSNTDWHFCTAVSCY